MATHLGLGGAFAQSAQMTGGSPAFDVVSVKLSNGNDATPSGIATVNGKLSAIHVTLRRCIMGAYGFGAQRVVGGPAWLDQTRFDIEPRTTSSITDDATFMRMLQPVLADHFALKTTWKHETSVLWS